MKTSVVGGLAPNVLKTIEDSPVIVNNLSGTDTRERLFDLELPFGCRVTGSLSRNKNKIASLEYIYIPEPLRGQGIGSRLTAAFTLEAVKKGAKELRCNFANYKFVEIGNKVWADENLQFYEVLEDYSEIELPMTYEQAVLSLKRADTLKANGFSMSENNNPGINAKVDLTKIDSLSAVA